MADIRKNRYAFTGYQKTDDLNPFLPLSEKEILKKLETSRKHAQMGMVRDADMVISEMKEKYGL